MIIIVSQALLDSYGGSCSLPPFKSNTKIIKDDDEIAFLIQTLMVELSIQWL